MDKEIFEYREEEIPYIYYFKELEKLRMDGWELVKYELIIPENPIHHEYYKCEFKRKIINK